MRRFISYLAFAFTLAVMVGCVKTDDITSDHQGMVTLKLSNNTLITTRAATSADEIALNEFWIDKVQCFFTTDNNTIVYASDLIAIDDRDGSADLNLTIPSSAMTTLFSGTGTPKIYVVANVGTKIDAETIDAVKDQVITLEAYKTDAEASADAEASTDAKASAQSKFVMDSALTAIKKSDNSIVTSDDKAIDLIRAAAKIQVQVNINKIITVGEGDATQTWIPVLGSIEMTYNRSVTSSTLNATADDAAVRASYEQTVADFKFAGTDAGSTATAYTLTQEVPFYSYPSSWTNTKDNEAYISLIIPWSKDNGASYLTYSYQIPVNFDGKKLERNHLYQLNVNVGVLGTLEGDVELTPSYVVVDWGTGAINTALSSPKYLVVDKNKFEIYNQSTAEIAFASSHDVVVTIDKIVYKNYANKDTRTITITSNSKTSVTEGSTSSSNFTGDSNAYADYKLPNTSTVELDKNAGYINFNHVMSANTFVPHEITLTIQHKDNASFSETIVITQYPPIYIVGDRSDGNVFVNGSGKGKTNYNDNSDNIGSLPSSLGTGVNSNPNQYNIYVTSLPATSTYIIGDPRVMQGGELANIDGVDNYRPTREDAINVVAPIFKIASSWGKTSQFGYQRAVERCASYQENGYPAGRWRVPTQAEIEFMQDRVNNGDIPSLFNGTSNNGFRGYWASSRYMYWPAYGSNGNSIGSYSAGFYNPEDNDDFSTNNGVRCVYDVWYWGDGKISNPGTFTFAD